MTKSARKSFSCSALTSAVNVPAAIAAPDDLAILRGDFVESLLLFSSKGGNEIVSVDLRFPSSWRRDRRRWFRGHRIGVGRLLYRGGFWIAIFLSGCGEYGGDFYSVFTFPFYDLFL